MITPEDVPLFVNNTDPVGIAVKGNSQICMGVPDRIDQEREVLRNRWIRMVIGKPAIGLREEFYNFTAHGAYDLRRSQACCPVPRVKDDLERYVTVSGKFIFEILDIIREKDTMRDPAVLFLPPLLSCVQESEPRVPHLP